MSELRQKMTDAMRQRGYSVRTHKSYICAVADLARYYRRSPDRLNAEEGKSQLSGRCSMNAQLPPEHGARTMPVVLQATLCHQGVTSIRCVSILLHHEVHEDHEGLLSHALRLRSQRHFRFVGQSVAVTH